MIDPRTVVLDNEAVQALASTTHPKHRRMLAVVEATAGRNRRRAGSMHLMVPTAVRVAAGWDRRRPTTAVINRLRVDDGPLDRQAADRAASTVGALGVSVADAHIAAVLVGAPAPHAVLTSDEGDMRRIADHVGLSVVVVPV